MAINLPDEIKRELAPILTRAREDNDFPGLRWVKPQSVHLTLHFLGELEQDDIERIIKIGEHAAGQFSGSKIQTGDWGGFPDLEFPRVVFIGLGTENSLADIQTEIGRQLERAGFEIDRRPWRTHLTVARNKDSGTRLNLDLPEVPGLAWTVRSFELMQSNLEADGAEYTIIKSFELKHEN